MSIWTQITDDYWATVSEDKLATVYHTPGDTYEIVVGPSHGVPTDENHPQYETGIIRALYRANQLLSGKQTREDLLTLQHYSLRVLSDALAAGHLTDSDYRTSLDRLNTRFQYL